MTCSPYHLDAGNTNKGIQKKTTTKDWDHVFMLTMPNTPYVEVVQADIDVNVNANGSYQNR